MKRWTHLLGAFLLMCGLLFFLEYDHKQEQKDKEQEEQDALVIQDFSWENLSEVTITTNLAAVTLTTDKASHRKDSLPSEWQWQMMAPLQTEAEVSDIQSILRLLKNLKQKGVIEEKANELAVFGLDLDSNKPIRIRLTAEKNNKELLIGILNPGSSGNYARFADSKKVFLIEQSLNYLVGKDSSFFRRKDLFSYDNSDIEKIEYRWQNERVTLARKDRHWMMLHPFTAQADDAQINTFLSDIKAARIDAYVSEQWESDKLKYGFGKPRAQIELSTANEKESYRILLGGDNSAKTAFYANKSGSPTIYQLPNYHLDKFKRNLADFVQRDISHFTVGEINRMQLSIKDRPPAHLILKDGKWSGDEPSATLKVDDEKVKELLGQLVGMQAKQYVSKTPLPLHQLRTPTLQILLSTVAQADKSANQYTYRFSYQLDKKSMQRSPKELVFVQGGADNFVFEFDPEGYKKIIDLANAVEIKMDANKDAK